MTQKHNKHRKTGNVSDLKPKHLKTIIESDQDCLKKFTELLEQRIKSNNSTAGTFDRAEEHRRYDAISRLIVGDETCAATAFNGEKLFVSTNNNNHRQDATIVKITSVMKGGSVPEEIEVIPVISLYHDKRLVKRLEAQEKVVYKVSESPYDKFLGMAYAKVSLGHFTSRMEVPVFCRMKTVSLSTKQNTVFKYKVDFDEHQIQGLPELELNMSIHKDFKFEIEEYATYSGEKIETDCLMKMHNKIDPFRYRVEKLVEHLQMVALIELRKEEGVFGEQKIEEARNLCEGRKKFFLNQSMFWEARGWIDKNHAISIHPYDSREDAKDKGKFDLEKARLDALNNFIKSLSDNFYDKMKELDVMKIDSNFVKSWKDDVIERISIGEFSCPDFVKVNPSAFMEKVWQYFCDIEKLEEYVREDVQRKGLFAKMFLKETGPFEEKKMVEIVDDLADGVHAEMRLLHKFMDTETKDFYISTSKLCCALCNLAINIGNKFGISGTHGKGFKWPLDSALTQDKFLKKFLGPDLFKIYNSMKDDVEYNHNIYNKKDVAIKIIESISQFDGGAAQYSSNFVGDIATESDSEDTDDSVAVTQTHKPLTTEEAQVSVISDEYQLPVYDQVRFMRELQHNLALCLENGEIIEGKEEFYHGCLGMLATYVDYF
jgi:hypothetical protein